MKKAVFSSVDSRYRFPFLLKILMIPSESGRTAS